MKLNYLLIFILASTTLFSCVGAKKFKALESRNGELAATIARLEKELAECGDKTMVLTNDGDKRRALLEAEIENLKSQNAFLKENNTQVLNRLQDLSVLSSTQAESVKKSLESLGAKDIFIQDLQGAMSRKDSLNMALVMNLKRALDDVNDEDIQIKVEKGVVFVSISDKMLFKSGQYVVTEPAKEVLGKVAKVLNDNPNLEFIVEGHTDNVPIKTSAITDNWDLSVLRATAVVRILQKDHNIDPKRMIAGGRGEFSPVASNDTREGKSANRRTRIVIQPELDQFFKIMEGKN